jgi:3'(2'), 5'-bisphosphate nucleotidase
MPFYKQRGIAVRTKADASPVTMADEAADRLITRALHELTPETPVVSEESAGKFNGRAPTGTFWLVDPLDGTREFINERDEFTVNIALIENGKAVLGVVFLPARDEVYAGAAGCGAVVITRGGRQQLRCRPVPADGALVAVSRSHGNDEADIGLLAGIKIAGVVQAGSSLKFCLVARGTADFYPRAGRTMEWDTAAGQAVLQAAGGKVVDQRGQPLAYGKPGLDNPAFIAMAASTAS